MFHGGILGLSGEPGLGLAEHGIPSQDVAVDGFHAIGAGRFDNVPIFIRTAEALCHRVVFIAVQSVEEAPIDSVEVEVNVLLKVGGSVHCKLQTAGELIAHVKRFVALA